MSRLLSIILLCCFVRSSFADVTLLTWPTDLRFNGAQKNGTYVLPPKLDGGFAMSDDGVLCTFDSKSGEAVLFPKVGSDQTMEGAIRVRVGDEPSAVAYKRFGTRSFFVVACNPTHDLYVLDAHSGQLQQKITTAAELINYLAPVAKDDKPYVYYSGGNAPQGQPGRVGRINLSTMTDEGRIDLPLNGVLDISVSADGVMLYATEPQANPTGFYAIRMLETDGKLIPQMFHEEKTSHPHILTSPRGGVVSGRQFFSLALEDLGYKYIDWPLAFSTARPMQFSVTGDGTIFIRSSEHRSSLVKIPNPFAAATSEPAMPKDAETRPTFDLFFDDAHNVLVALNSKNVAVIPIPSQKNETTAPAVVRVDLEGQPSMLVNEPWTAKLHCTDSAAKLELVNPPQGLTLQGDQLQWKPEITQVGEYQVRLITNSGGAQQDHSIMLSVRRGGIACPFYAQHIYVSPDGMRGLLAVFHGDGNPKNRVDENISRLAVIDLKNGTVIAEKTLLIPIRAAGIDQHFVYVSMQASSAFKALSLTDLSEVKTVGTPGPAWRFQTVGERLYPSISEKPTVWYSLPGLTLDPDAPPVNPRERSTTPSPVELSDGWNMDGAVFDATGTHLRWIEHDTVFPSLVPDSAPIQVRDATKRWAGAWDAYVNWSTVRRLDGRQMFEVPVPHDRDPIIIPDQPVVVVPEVRVVKIGTSDIYQRISQIDSFALANGRRLNPIVVDSVAMTGGAGNGVSQLAVGGHTLIAQVADRLYVVPTSNFAGDGVPLPLIITPPEGTITVAAGRKTTIPMIVSGGKPPLSFSLNTAIDGVSIDEKTGVINIDPQPLLANVGQACQEFAKTNYARDPKTGQPVPMQKSLDAMREKVAIHYKTLTGNQSAGVIVALPLMVSVGDSEQSIDRRSLTLLIDVPAERAMNAPIIFAPSH